MRRLLLFVSTVSVGLGVVAACNSADFTPATPKDCSKVECTCEEDPSQPTCIGVPGAPDGGLEASTLDATTLDADLDATNDAATDAADDASDAADASDQ